MSNLSAIVTYPFFAFGGYANYYGSVISADPSATAVAIHVPRDFTPDDVFSATFTVGPWAQVTPAPSVSTGVFDITVTFEDYSASRVDMYRIHCDVASITTLAVCTKTDDSPYSGETPVTSYTTTAFDLPITITAGLEKLAAATQAGASVTPAPKSSTSASWSHASSQNHTVTSSSPTSATNSSASAATAGHTGAASNAYGVNMGTVGLFGLLVAFFTR